MPTLEYFRLGIDNIPNWFLDKLNSQELHLHRVPFHESRAKNYGQLYCEITVNGETKQAKEGDFIVKTESGLAVCASDDNGLLVWCKKPDETIDDNKQLLNEIVQSLRCCNANDTEGSASYCQQCPTYYNPNHDCYEAISHKVIELYNKLQNENEQLLHIAETAIECIGDCDYAQKYSTNDRLESAINDWEASDCSSQFYAILNKHRNNNGG